MSSLTSPELERERQLHEILLAFVEALEAGQTPDPRQLLAAHPEFAAEVTEFLAARDQLERLAAPLRAAGHAGRLSSNSSGGCPGSKEEHPPAPADPKSVPPLGRLGDFHLLREVGRGGMGIVYEAEQISLNRRVALKVLPFVAALDPRQLQRFKNEAQAAALLHHTNIVPVHAVGSERGVHYYAMQFIEGQSLAALLAELRHAAARKAPDQGTALSAPAPEQPMIAGDGDPTQLATAGKERTSPWPPQRARTVAGAADTLSPLAAISTERSTQRSHFYRRAAHFGMKAAEALEHAHELGVVHRDIKPANLLLDVRGNLWITDFGLAMLQNEAGLTTTGELVGTLRYMSPEQVWAKRGVVDHRTDIYSLGVTLYELLTLQPLFECSDRPHLLHQITQEEPPSPCTVDRAIPVELETIVLKAIAKSPADRYATAQELADDLQRFLNDQPVRARRPSLVDRATKWGRRHKPVVVLALVLLLTATAGLSISTLLIARAHGEAKAAYDRERHKAEEALEQRSRAEANFLEARQAVDFFTQVSEEELVDKPAVLDVRRRLLEGALQYYQEFIDQHHDDPSIQAELASSRARVAQILDELDAQQDYLHLMLLTMLLPERAIQDDLRTTSDQADKIRELAEQLAEQRHQAFWNMRRLPEAQRTEKFKEMAAANEKAIAAILTPAQVHRLNQIALQQRGPEALGEPQVAQGLRLTRSQKSNIRTIQEDIQRAMREGMRHGGHRAEAHQKNHELWKNAVAKIQEILTPEQQAAWKEMTGEPFHGRIPFAFQPGFGPPWSRPH